MKNRLGGGARNAARPRKRKQCAESAGAWRSASITRDPHHPSRGRRPQGRTYSNQRRSTMKILSIFAVVLSLFGAANVAMAQSVRDQGVVTGSQANAAEHQIGEYTYGR